MSQDIKLDTIFAECKKWFSVSSTNTICKLSAQNKAVAINFRTINTYTLQMIIIWKHAGSSIQQFNNLRKFIHTHTHINQLEYHEWIIIECATFRSAKNIKYRSNLHTATHGHTQHPLSYLLLVGFMNVIISMRNNNIQPIVNVAECIRRELLKWRTFALERNRCLSVFVIALSFSLWIGWALFSCDFSTLSPHLSVIKSQCWRL